jgi:hypothetical protein
MRKHALQRYFIYRLKLMELIHFYNLWNDLSSGRFVPPSGTGHHTGRDYAQSLKTVCLSWFCTIVDQSNGGMDVFDLWRLLFPKHREEIDHLWNEIEPRWNILRDFRNNCGFHASPPGKYFGARQRLKESPDVATAMQDFLKLATRFLNIETEELPEFVPEVEACVKELSLKSDIHVSRQFLQKMSILEPDV